MDEENIAMDYPTLFIPKKCTLIETNCEISDNVYIDLHITTPDTEGHNTLIYSGFCNIKLIDSYNIASHGLKPSNSTNELSNIEQTPIVLTEANHLSFPYNESQVWIDPARSPYVYNHYDTTSQEPYTFKESTGRITVEHHNTYITQNVYNCNDSSPEFVHRMSRKETNEVNSYNEDEFECGVFLSQLPEEIHNETQIKARMDQNYIQSENNALKQLMSTDIQSLSRQRKTILFLGHDSDSGQTIQNISYYDPMVKCAELEVDNEVIIESSSPPTKVQKKKYQCDKCKKIFDHISTFRQHMVGNHTTNNPISTKGKEVSFVCIECGKNLKSQWKFELHCLGHGDPDLECPKCHKVYASKFTLRAHLKIHNRKFSCKYCLRSYAKVQDLKTHLEKIHFALMCVHDKCTFVTEEACEFKKHVREHATEFTHFDDDDEDGEQMEIITQENFKSENLESIETHNGEEVKDHSIHNKIYFDEDDDDISVVIAEDNLKSESLDPKETENREKIRKADSVIAKVMSNKIFLLNSKKAKTHGKYHKTCEVCYKKFERIGDLKRHLIEHVVRSTLAKSPVCRNGTLEIICEVCQAETFSQIDKYKAHLREHAKLTIYKCTFCDKSFSDSSNFSKHKKIHGMNHLQCDLCHRKFNSKKMIAQHMEYHIKNKPLVCRYCNRKFHFPSMLNKHMKCAHTNVSNVKFHCRFCDEYFKTLKDKWDHEWMVHNVRKMIVDCLICNSKFRKYSELKRHCLEVHHVSIMAAKHIVKMRKANYV